MKLAATVYNQLAKNLASFVVCRVAFKPGATRCTLGVYSSLCGKLIAQYCILSSLLVFILSKHFLNSYLKNVETKSTENKTKQQHAISQNGSNMRAPYFWRRLR